MFHHHPQRRADDHQVIPDTAIEPLLGYAGALRAPRVAEEHYQMLRRAGPSVWLHLLAGVVAELGRRDGIDVRAFCQHLGDEAVKRQSERALGYRLPVTNIGE